MGEEPLSLGLPGEAPIYEGRYEPEDAHHQAARAFTDEGKYMMIWKLEDGSWKWDSDAWNSNLPPT